MSFLLPPTISPLPIIRAWYNDIKSAKKMAIDAYITVACTIIAIMHQ